MMMREQLARLARERHAQRMGFDVDDWDDLGAKQDDWFAVVDIVLRVLLEPSEGMVKAGGFINQWTNCRKTFPAMIQHILDEADGQAPQA